MEITLQKLSVLFSNYNYNEYSCHNYLCPPTTVKKFTLSLKSYDQHTLYLADYHQLKKVEPSILKGSILIVSNNASDDLSTFLRDSNLSFVFQIFDINMDLVLNSILEFIDLNQKFEAAEAELLSSMITNKGLQNLVDVATRLLGNPLFIRDTSFKILSFSSDIELDDFVWNEITQRKYQSYNSFQKLMKQGFLNSTNDSRVPIYFKNANEIDGEDQSDAEIEFHNEQNPLFIKKCVKPIDNQISISRSWTNLYVGNKFCGHIVVLEAFRKFNAFDYMLMKTLSEVISIEFQRNRLYDNSVTTHQDSLLIDLIEGNILNADILNDRLKLIDQYLKPPFRMFIARSRKDKVASLPFYYINTFFEKGICACHSLVYNGSLVILMSDIKNDLFDNDVFKRLENSVQELDSVAGISRSYDNLLETKKHYIQADKSIQNGLTYSPEKSLFLYEQLIINQILNICSLQTDLFELCNPKLIQLIEYDKKFNTAYTNNLYVYIMTFKGSSNLAHEMKVHRNTLYYRLKKIEELLSVDLSNIETYFDFYLSFKILEQIKYNFN